MHHCSLRISPRQQSRAFVNYIFLDQGPPSLLSGYICCRAFALTIKLLLCLFPLRIDFEISNCSIRCKILHACIENSTPFSSRIPIGEKSVLLLNNLQLYIVILLNYIHLLLPSIPQMIHLGALLILSGSVEYFRGFLHQFKLSLSFLSTLYEDDYNYLLIQLQLH